MRHPLPGILAATALLTPAVATAAPDARAVEKLLGVPSLTVQSLRLGAAPTSVHLDLGGRTVTLHLTPSNLEAPGFRLLVERADGMHEVPAPPAHTFRGTVDEIPGSVVGGTLSDGQLRAAVALGDGRTFHVQPLRDFDPYAEVTAHVVMDGADLGEPLGTCEVADPPVIVPPEARRSTGTAANKPAEVAFDADYEFFALNNSDVQLATNDIRNITSMVNAVYERDCGITHYLSAIIIRTTPADPYTSTDASAMLNEFRSHWNSSQTGIRRDTAHLMTGKDLAGGTLGIALVGVVCNRSSAYGLSQSRFSTILARRVALTAHELGHNWNAVHCDGALPCNIMCSSINGCSGIGLPNFEPMGITAITSFAATRTCLNQPVGVGDPAPSEWLRLAAPSPTPFSEETVIRFYLEASAAAELDIYDIAGHRIVRLAEGVQDTGWHQLEWRGQDHAGRQLRSGIYYARLRAAGLSLTRKLVLMR